MTGVLLAVLIAAQAGVLNLVPWDAKEHPHYFRYQKYLVKLELAGETQAAWEKLDAEARRKKVADGEALLKRRLAELVKAYHLSPRDQELLREVWGPDAVLAVEKAQRAGVVNDGGQLKKALEGVQRLSDKLGSLGLEWSGLFDGAGPPIPALKDSIAVEARPDFLTSLDEPNIQRALASPKEFEDYLRRKKAPPEAIPSLSAMYQVLTSAPEPERSELKHLLPTVVRFLEDGKKIVFEELPGAVAFADEDDYGRPKKVGVTSASKTLNPIVAGYVMAHEFQHIYEMYEGRCYTLDSEMRAFKVNVLYARSVEKAFPDKYAELSNSNDPMTQLIRKDWEGGYNAALDRSPQNFAWVIDYRIAVFSRGAYRTRLPLREAVDPELGAPRELAVLRRMLAERNAGVEALEKEQERIRKQGNPTPSWVLGELEERRREVMELDKRVALRERCVRRMQSEVEWLNKKSKAKRPEEDEPFDLHLTVDRAYVTP